MGNFTDLKITDQELADHGMTSLAGTKWTNQAEMLKAKIDGDGTFVAGRLGQTLDLLDGLNLYEALHSADIKFARLNADKVIETSADGVMWEATGSSGHVVLDKDGNALPQRSRLKFSGPATVTDNGTETVVTALKGDTGLTGPQGIQGVTGAQGATGPTGPVIVPDIDSNGIMSFHIQDTAEAPTPRNVRGPQGVAGVQGPQGVQGSQGPQGVQGPLGPQGNQGLPGTDGRSFTIEDIYLTLGALKSAYPTGNENAYQVSADKGIYIWSETENDWHNLGQLQGPIGPQGIQGVQGAQGAQGVQGVQGTAGKSAYTAATESGYAGTESAFNTALSTTPDHIADATKHVGTETKTTPVDADSVALVDSSDSSKVKRLSWAALKTALSSVFCSSSDSRLNDARTPTAHKATHATGGADALIPGDIGAAAQATYTATLTTTWTGSSAPYTQTVSVAGVLATDNPTIDAVLSSDSAASKLILTAWSSVSRITTAAGSITAYCYNSKPTVAIPMQIKAVR